MHLQYVCPTSLSAVRQRGLGYSPKLQLIRYQLNLYNNDDRSNGHDIDFLAHHVS